MAFSILSQEHPLRIVEIMNRIKNQYGVSVTFQAVRKAVLELVEEDVLKKQDKKYSIRVEWVVECKQALEKLHDTLLGNGNASSVDAINEDIGVFSFDSVNNLMKFWQELVDNWFKELPSGGEVINCYQTGHIWEVLLHIEKEEKIMGQMKKKGVQSYAIVTSDSQLDRGSVRFYNKVGVKAAISLAHSIFDRAHCIGTYGDLVVQTTYPEETVQELDLFFKNNETLEEFDISHLLRIVDKKRRCKLTVMRNAEMAKRINKTILDQFVDL